MWAILLLSVVTVSSLWLGLLSITGSVSTSGGASEVTFDVWDISISDGLPTDKTFNMNGTAGHNVTFSIVDSIVSTDGGCDYLQDVDLVFDVDGLTLSESGSVTIPMSDGNNAYLMTATPDSASCPLGGSIEVNGTIS